MNDSHQTMNPSEFPPDEKILAWLDGEMAPPEAEAFQKTLRSDEALRTLVEHTRQTLLDARAWAEAEPPGLERVEQLPIPQLDEVAAAPARVVAVPRREAPARSRTPRRTWAWLARGLAAAAIFAIGFLAGQLNRHSPYAGPASPAPASFATRQAPITPPPASAEPARNNVLPDQAPLLNGREKPAPAPPARASLPRVPQADQVATAAPAPPVATAREENGRVIVETRLTGSGGRAVWVVDGGFQVASNR